MSEFLRSFAKAASTGRAFRKKTAAGRPPVRACGPRPCAARIVCLLLAPLLLLCARPCLAENAPQGWRAVISEHPTTPAYLVVVDKSRQELAFFERRSPLRRSRLFACTTGQAVGDKEMQGDLKTPEGIYFVGYRIGSGLDFIKYGHEAYTLNYPNPVDRLRRKTGYGIWIHGRGEPLTPLQTEGCVSLNNEDLTTLSKALMPGTPVALTGSLVFEPEPDKNSAEEVRELKQKVEDWAASWSGRSSKYFDLYDTQAYSLANEPFAAFKAQKERLFSSLPWIRTTVRDIQVLKGPDYWVTWFYQDYQAPNLSTRGVRRLYWGKDKQGEFKILGMEWQPGLDTTLVASAEPVLAPSVSDASPVWPAHALQGLGGKPSPVAAASAPAPAAAPADPGQILAAGPQTAASPERQKAEQGPALDLPRPAPEAFLLAEARKKAQSEQAASRQPSAGRDAAKEAQAEAPARPGFDLPPPLPAQGLSPAPREEQAKAGQRPGHAPEQVTEQTPDRVAEPAMEQAKAEAPAQTPEQMPDSAPEGRILAAATPATAQAAEKDGPPAPASLADKISAVSGRVEDWRRAWEAGDIDAYMAFYAKDARQDRRKGAAAIRNQKKNLWARTAPAVVRLDNVRIIAGAESIAADMLQEYENADGKGDVGLKTLIFKETNGVWLITQEDWSPLADEKSGN